ncbi:MAG TPA: hypothetical protein VK694_06710 [Verrucomicrobiae bacterium]|nr:hypothetical protein [Verrucomicrobiae bacterium]
MAGGRERGAKKGNNLRGPPTVVVVDRHTRTARGEDSAGVGLADPVPGLLEDHAVGPLPGWAARTRTRQQLHSRTGLLDLLTPLLLVTLGASLATIPPAFDDPLVHLAEHGNAADSAREQSQSGNDAQKDQRHQVQQQAHAQAFPPAPAEPVHNSLVLGHVPAADPQDDQGNRQRRQGVQGQPPGGQATTLSVEPPDGVVGLLADVPDPIAQGVGKALVLQVAQAQRKPENDLEGPQQVGPWKVQRGVEAQQDHAGTALALIERRVVHELAGVVPEPLGQRLGEHLLRHHHGDLVEDLVQQTGLSVATVMPSHSSKLAVVVVEHDSRAEDITKAPAAVTFIIPDHSGTDGVVARPRAGHILLAFAERHDVLLGHAGVETPLLAISLGDRVWPHHDEDEGVDDLVVIHQILQLGGRSTPRHFDVGFTRPILVYHRTELQRLLPLGGSNGVSHRVTSIGKRATRRSRYYATIS